MERIKRRYSTSWHCQRSLPLAFLLVLCLKHAQVFSSLKQTKFLLQPFCPAHTLDRAQPFCWTQQPVWLRALLTHCPLLVTPCPGHAPARQAKPSFSVRALLYGRGGRSLLAYNCPQSWQYSLFLDFLLLHIFSIILTVSFFQQLLSRLLPKHMHLECWGAAAWSLLPSPGPASFLQLSAFIKW